MLIICWDGGDLFGGESEIMELMILCALLRFNCIIVLSSRR